MISPRLSWRGRPSWSRTWAGGIDAERVIDRRAEVGGIVAPGGGIGGDLVGLADHLAAAHAAAGENRREHARPVVAAGAMIGRR